MPKLRKYHFLPNKRFGLPGANTIRMLAASHGLIIFFFALLSLILVLVWLPAGSILGGWDVGIPTLNPAKALSETALSWWESHATGITSPVTYTAIPFYLFLSGLDLIGLTPDKTQKILLWIILFGGSLSIYFLAIENNLSKRNALIAALFSIFNVLTLTVLHRGVHNGIIMLFFAPLSLLVVVKGIKSRKFMWLIPLLVISFLFSYVYGPLAYIFALWLLWILYLTIIFIYAKSVMTSRKFVFLYTLLLFLFWIITNCWWLIHFLESGKYILGQFNPDQIRQSSSDILLALRPQTDLINTLRGISRFYFYDIKDWGNTYTNPFFILLSWIPPIIIFSTILFKRNYQSANWRFLIVLIVIVQLISKGAAPPFGAVNKLVYDFIPALAPLRNPYEKIGILLIIPYSLLFSLGLMQIGGLFSKKISPKIITLLHLVVLFAVLVVLVWPLWLGKLFVSQGSSFSNKYPSYYNEANNWLKNKSKNQRILHLPATSGESVDYEWGYNGVEPSQYFFDGSSLAYGVGISSVDVQLKNLIELIHNKDDQAIYNAFKTLNIGWVVIHNETLWRSRYLEPIEQLNSWLDQKPLFLEHQQDFGPLSVWKVKQAIELNHIYSANTIKSVSPYRIESLRYAQKEASGEAFILESNNQKNDDNQILDQYIDTSSVFPTSIINYSGPRNTLNYDNALQELTYPRYLPGSKMYPLISIKESLLNTFKGYPVEECFDLASKRLAESAYLAKANKLQQAIQNLDRYQNQLAMCNPGDGIRLASYISNPEIYELVLETLIRQLVVLEKDFTSPEIRPKARDELENLRMFISTSKIAPKYADLQNKQENGHITYTYNLNKSGTYTIKFDRFKNKTENFFPKIVQIDETPVSIDPLPSSDGQSVEFPSQNFPAGYHEIQIKLSKSEQYQPERMDLLPAEGVGKIMDGNQIIYEFDTSKGKSLLTGFIPNIDISQKYKIEFDYFVIRGSYPKFWLVENPVSGGDNSKIPQAINLQLYSNNYDHYWLNWSYQYSPKINTHSSEIHIEVPDWNNCQYFFSPEKCASQDLNKMFRRPSLIWIKNLRVEKIFSDQLILEMKINTAKKFGDVPIVFVNKKSPVQYDLKIQNQKPPYLLLFSETFHPKWAVKDSKGTIIDLPHFAINGYANGWLIEKELPESVEISFNLQSLLRNGIIISLVGFLLACVVFYYLDKQGKFK